MYIIEPKLHIIASPYQSLENLEQHLEIVQHT